jgi:hypothetical protein
MNRTACDLPINRVEFSLLADQRMSNIATCVEHLVWMLA